MLLMKTKLKQIEKRIEGIKSELLRFKVMRPGSLTRQYKDPKSQTGAYYQLSYTLDMRSRTEYIRKEWVNDIRRQVKRYKRYKQLNAEWVALSIEHSKLTMKLKHTQ
jgi:spore coat polysaccharide biosynthesis protein SpsF (cytidylyltransferase family)